MALTSKEREKIIEDETLRYETRQNLHTKACAGHKRRGRWLWWLGLGLLAYALWCHFMCGGMSCRHEGMGMGMAPHSMMGKRCPSHMGLGQGADPASQSPEGPGTPKP